jgi:hypothetical protein
LRIRYQLPEKMGATQAKRAQRFRLTAFVLAFIAVFALLVVLLARPRWTGRQTVAEAQARAKRARQELLLTLHATNAAATFVEKMGVTKSPAAQMVGSAGSTLAAAAYRQDDMSQVNVHLAQREEHLIAIATNTVARFDDFNQAQEAFATLTLAGIEDIIIRPQGRSKISAGPANYELCTGLEFVPTAVAALRTNPVSRVETFGDFRVALGAMHTLEAHAIRATIRHLKWPGQTETDKPAYSLYVMRVDADRARSLLSGR